MHKISNRNTVKISYNCMENIGSIVLGPNRNILNLIVQFNGGNWRMKNSCALMVNVLLQKIFTKPMFLMMQT